MLPKPSHSQYFVVYANIICVRLKLRPSKCFWFGGGLMRPAGPMKAHMRPATQFEFETPAIKNHCCKKQNNLSFNGFDAGYSNS